MKVIALKQFLWFNEGSEIEPSDYDLSQKELDKWFELGLVKSSEYQPKEEIKEVPTPKTIVIGDINNDGKFDKEDSSIAGKVLAKSKKKQ